MDSSTITQALQDHAAAIKTVAGKRQRIADLLTAIDDEPAETNPDYREAQVLHQVARRADLTDQLRAAETEVTRTSTEATAAARDAIARTRTATAAELTGEAWARAAAIATTLQAELKGASVDTLHRRLEGATLAGDRAELHAAAVVIEPLIANLQPREERERRLVSSIRNQISDVRAALRPASLTQLADDARALLLTAGRAEGDVHAGREDRGERAFAAASSGKQVPWPQ